jgi:HD-GYP domain-containing protein (c-di-GMP phosphodiesterase class II)
MNIKDKSQNKMYYNSDMENSELFEKKFSVLREISNYMVVTDNISAITNLMLDLAINYTNAKKGSLMLLSDGGELYILAARGIDIKLTKTYRVKIGEGIAGIVAKNREPIMVENIDHDDRFKKGEIRDRYKTKSFISCPVVSKNKLLGILNINDKKDNTPFTNDEFELLKNIANHAAIALDNAFLMNQLRSKAAHLEELNRKLIDTDVVKSEFLTRISHDLRTPLNSIKGSIYYLKQSEERDLEKLRDFYDIISNETNNLIYIVENLLNFLRLEDETQVIKKTIIDLPELLNEVLNSKLLTNSLKRKKIDLKIEMGENVSNIVGDRVRIVQFFINLLEGLSIHLEQGDSIVTSVQEKDSVLINLILPRTLPEETVADLFRMKNKFKIDQSEEKVKLYLAWKIADDHQWQLKGENRDNQFLLLITIPKSLPQQSEAMINSTMDMFTEFTSELLDLNTCSIMFANELTGELSIKSAQGLDDNIVKLTRIKFGDSIAGWVALEGKPLLIEDIETDPRFAKKSISQYNTKSLISIPLKVHDKVVGVINLNNKKTAQPFTFRDFCIASVLSDRISSFIEKIHSGEYEKNEYSQLLRSFEKLLSAIKRHHKKDSSTQDLMIKIMDKIGVKEEDKHVAIYISIIYDLGLALVDKNILSKKKLAPSEANILKVHPYTSISLLSNFEFSEDVQKAILHHHERYDGTGYPDKLKGEQIPFLSRVLSVVDAFSAMTTKRPYRNSLTTDKALKEIKEGSGSKYDPKIVEALHSLISNNNN